MLHLGRLVIGRFPLDRVRHWWPVACPQFALPRDARAFIPYDEAVLIETTDGHRYRQFSRWPLAWRLT